MHRFVNQAAKGSPGTTGETALEAARYSHASLNSIESGDKSPHSISKRYSSPDHFPWT